MGFKIPNDPVELAEEYLGLQLFEYQKKMLRALSKTDKKLHLIIPKQNGYYDSVYAAAVVNALLEGKDIYVCRE